LLVSPHWVEEARRHIAPKHPEKVEDLERLLQEMRMMEECGAAEAEWACELGLPLKDAPILGAAYRRMPTCW